MLQEPASTPALSQHLPLSPQRAQQWRLFISNGTQYRGGREAVGGSLTTMPDRTIFLWSVIIMPLVFRNPPSAGLFLRLSGPRSRLDTLFYWARVTGRQKAQLAWIRQQRKSLPSESNLSQPGFLWPNGQSCLVVMQLQHSHSDPHDPVIVLGMSAKLSDTNYYN